MKIYLIIIEDHHTDVEILPRRDKELAIKEAKNMVIGLAGQYRDEIDESLNLGLYHASYSCEGDCVYVIEAELE